MKIFFPFLSACCLALLLGTPPLRAAEDAWAEANRLGIEAYRQGDYAAAARHLQQALAEAERPDAAPGRLSTSLNNLGLVLKKLGRLQEAEPLYRRALALDEAALGPDHPDLAPELNNLGTLLHGQGRYDEAEAFYRRSLAILEGAYGAEHPGIAGGLINLALLFKERGRYAEAERLYRQALAMNERMLGPDHPNVAININNLATLLHAQGRYDEAEPLARRALDLGVAALGAGHPAVAERLGNLGTTLEKLGRFREAEDLYLQALAILEQALGPEHPALIASLENLGELYWLQGRHDEAEQHYRRALDLAGKALGPDDPLLATAQGNLAALHHATGRHDEALALHRRALDLREKILGADHPDVALDLVNLSFVLDAAGQPDAALDAVRRANALLGRRFAAQAGPRFGGPRAEQMGWRGAFLQQVALLSRSQGVQAESRRAESFLALQLANASDTGSALAQMAARFAVAGDALGVLVREKQDVLARLRSLDRQWLQARARPAGERDERMEQQLQAETEAVEKRRQDLDREIGTRFPEYEELVQPRPLPLAEAQALLRHDEALMAWLLADKESFLWVLRQDRGEFLRLPIGAAEIGALVRELRSRADPGGGALQSLGRRFPAEAAHELHTRLFAPAAPLLAGAGHVMLVLDGPLQSLPFSLLLEDLPQGEYRGFEDYRDWPWLMRRHAFTTLPAVGALRMLRRFARTGAGSGGFLGFGDPGLEGEAALSGEEGKTRSLKIARLYAREAVADPRLVRSLAPLPDTADELRALARVFGASAHAARTRDQATESEIKGMDLTGTRILAFSTHGLVADELKLLAGGNYKGGGEPALVLTPPEHGTEQDDGLLTASEIARLKLDADWVILSACNTAASDGTPGAEGLSGLAKAFFYAGSRALLVSHWPVVSDAAVDLVTGTAGAAAADPGTGKARALQQAMLAMLVRTDKPHFAHPLFWAPFVVVGEGGGTR